MMAGSSHAPSGVRILAKASDPAANEAAAANFQDQFDDWSNQQRNS
jgi:hypothetical protein